MAIGAHGDSGGLAGALTAGGFSSAVDKMFIRLPVTIVIHSIAGDVVWSQGRARFAGIHQNAAFAFLFPGRKASAFPTRSRHREDVVRYSIAVVVDPIADFLASLAHSNILGTAVFGIGHTISVIVLVTGVPNTILIQVVLVGIRDVGAIILVIWDAVAPTVFVDLPIAIVVHSIAEKVVGIFRDEGVQSGTSTLRCTRRRPLAHRGRIHT